MEPTDRMTIRSFRVVFELERRIHKIDRWRIPVPYGVPLRGVAYAGAALLAVVLAGRLPMARGALDLLPPPVRFVILPVGLAYLLDQVRVDGRPAHAVAAAWLGLRIAPARLVGFRPAPHAGARAAFGDVTLVPDERSARYRRARIKGPGRVLLRYPARARRRGAVLELEQTSDRPLWRAKRVALKPGQRLVVR
jgi:hypothetical protein